MLTTDFGVGSNFEDADFDDRECEVLEFLSSEQNAYFSFQGLKRRLGIHQETLTRTLKRLEEADMIEKSSAGYRIRNNSSSYTFSVHGNQAFRPIVDALLPAQVDVTVMFQKLKGRWFSEFRWLGYSQKEGILSLSWISEDGHVQLCARLGDGKVIIGAASQTEAEEARKVSAAYQLFEHVSKVAEEIVQTEPLLAS